ncbi:MAG: hypothetical protein II964_01765 [Synergistaceae bacterium]|nr:hypothetical protein [Synergistaceae bacterium]
MKKFLYAVFLAALVFAYSAASITSWKRIRLESAGTISLPSSWNVIAESSSVVENAYGKGVSCRSLLTAEENKTSSLTILTYWPPSGKEPSDVARDVSDSLRPGSGGRRSTAIKFGNIEASSITYPYDSINAQKVTAFIKGEKIYCLVLTYDAKDEYRTSSLVRHIISHWRF